MEIPARTGKTSELGLQIGEQKDDHHFYGALFSQNSLPFKTCLLFEHLILGLGPTTPTIKGREFEAHWMSLVSGTVGRGLMPAGRRVSAEADNDGVEMRSPCCALLEYVDANALPPAR